MTRRRWLIVVTVFLALTLAACGGKDDKSTQTEATAAPAAQSTAPKAAAGAKPTAVPAAQPTAEPTDVPVATPEEELLSLASRDTGLDQLTSYRATWRCRLEVHRSW